MLRGQIFIVKAWNINLSWLENHTGEELGISVVRMKGQGPAFKPVVKDWSLLPNSLTWVVAQLLNCKQETLAIARKLGKSSEFGRGVGLIAPHLFSRASAHCSTTLSFSCMSVTRVVANFIVNICSVFIPPLTYVALKIGSICLGSINNSYPKSLEIIIKVNL